MDIKIIMHSTLDVHLKPDLKIINHAIAELEDSGKGTPEFLQKCLWDAQRAQALVEREKTLADLVKQSTEKEIKDFYIAQKQGVGVQLDQALTSALENLALAGGGDLYHYNYDVHFNRIVAGLMGSTCYMKDTFDALQHKGIKNILAIASTVENNGHHSTFGHSHLTLEITDIPKALAMVINNEKEYCTSEKSARYTVMNEMEPAQNALYEKWKDKLTCEIDKKYGSSRPFFDQKGIKTSKLAQENARYMISVFTPTNMVYTTSFRQLNYLAHWFEDVIADENANEFYATLKPQMLQFVQFVKDNDLYSPQVEDHKGRKLTLFGDGLLKDVMSSSVYAMSYNTSFACLAQLQRHRTIHYNIDEFQFFNAPKQFYIPPIIAASEDKRLASEWQKDIKSVAASYPQGMLVPVVEKGETDDFLLKAYERVCVCAQKEIRDLTQTNCYKFASTLNQEINGIRYSIATNAYNSVEGRLQDRILLHKFDSLQQKAQTFEKLSKGARCTAGYQCTSPCRFAEGVSLKSEV